MDARLLILVIESKTERKITFYNVYGALLGYFKVWVCFSDEARLETFELMFGLP